MVSSRKFLLTAYQIEFVMNQWLEYASTKHAGQVMAQLTLDGTTVLPSEGLGW